MSTPLADAEVTALPSMPGISPQAREVRRARDDLMQRLFGDAAPPVTWGRYELRRRVGAGGMGVVYAVWDPQLGREVALKVISASAAAAAGSGLSLARLAREAQAMARINHPNVVPVYDVGRDDDQVYFAMELVHGGSLDRWLALTRRTTDEILDVFDQIAAGVAAAHRVGLLHRDLKPHNVLVGDDGRVRVADFGLARALVPQSEAMSQTDESWPVTARSGSDTAVTAGPDLTETGATVGTPAYMSPEQHAGAPLDERTDVYAWTVALFVALFDALPFPSHSLAGLYTRKAEGVIVWPMRSRPVPRWLIALLERGMQPAPGRRFATMDAVRAALRRGRRGSARRRLAVVGAAAVVGVAGFVGRGPDGRCDAATAELDRVWNEPRAADLELVFTRASPIGGTQFPTAAAGLRAWAAAWSDARTRSCNAAVANATSGEPSEIDGRAACLDRALAGFAAALDAFERADATVVERSAEIVQRLDDPARCLDPDAAQDPTPASSSPRTAAMVERLAQLDVERFAGRIPRHVDELLQLAAESDTLGEPMLRARTHMLLAHALRGSGRAQDAVREAELVHAVAFAGKLGSLEQEAAHTLAVLLGKHLGRTQEGLTWADAAGAAIERYGLPPRERALLETDIGSIYGAAGDLEAAIEHQLRGVALAEALPDGGGRTLAIALNELGVTQARNEDAEAASATRERTVEAFEAALGPEHPFSALARVNLASSLRDVGRPAEAEPVLEAALEDLERALGPRNTNVIKAANELGALREEVLDDTPGALQAYARAFAGVEALHDGADQALRSGVIGNYADVLWHVGRYAEALELHRRALELDEDRVGPEDASVANGALRVGHDALALGLRDEARSALLRARTIAERTENPRIVAHAEFALAVLVRDEDPVAARALALRARDAARAVPERSALIDAWIVALDTSSPLPDDWRARAQKDRLAVVP